MNILHISLSDSAGGADRAAYRIHDAQVKSGLSSKMLVLHKGTTDENVSPITTRPISTLLWQKLQRVRQNVSQKKWSTNNPVQHHFGMFGYGLVDEINSSDADIVNLHWVADFLSISDISRIQKPIVWTLHDMWAFCGGEHYAPDDASARFRKGYTTYNRPPGEEGPDLNRKAWERKRLHWKNRKFNIVGPSHWISECARQSTLFTDAAIHCIPNPLDTKAMWRPVPKDTARAELGLPVKDKLILMGAAGGLGDPRKGGDLLLGALKVLLSERTDDVGLIVYGQQKPVDGDSSWPCNVYWLGEVRDDSILAKVYSAADVMVVPSRQDNLPNTAVEAHACGTPVVSFDIGGLPDIVDHKVTGYLARPFEMEDLANGIEWSIEDSERNRILSEAARVKATEKFAEKVVAESYKQLYENVN